MISFHFHDALSLSGQRGAGITVPITTNDAWPGGHFTSVDIYGIVISLPSILLVITKDP